MIGEIGIRSRSSSLSALLIKEKLNGIQWWCLDVVWMEKKERKKKDKLSLTLLTHFSKTISISDLSSEGVWPPQPFLISWTVSMATASTRRRTTEYHHCPIVCVCFSFYKSQTAFQVSWSSQNINFYASHIITMIVIADSWVVVEFNPSFASSDGDYYTPIRIRRRLSPRVGA